MRRHTVFPGATTEDKAIRKHPRRPGTNGRQHELLKKLMTPWPAKNNAEDPGLILKRCYFAMQESPEPLFKWAKSDGRKLLQCRN
jgi:hypothetical protein